MIWSSKSSGREIELRETDKEFICAFDFTVDTRAPFAKLILDSLADNLTRSIDKIDKDHMMEKNVMQLESIQSTVDYIRSNYKTLRNLEVEAEDFGISACQIESSEFELEIEMRMNYSSTLYHDVADLLEETCSLFCTNEESDKITDSSIVNYCKDIQDGGTEKEVHSFI